jgi:hypothetical protein
MYGMRRTDYRVETCVNKRRVSCHLALGLVTTSIQSRITIDLRVIVTLLHRSGPKMADAGWSSHLVMNAVGRYTAQIIYHIYSL